MLVQTLVFLRQENILIDSFNCDLLYYSLLLTRRFTWNIIFNRSKTGYILNLN